MSISFTFTLKIVIFLIDQTLPVHEGVPLEMDIKQISRLIYGQLIP